MTAPVDTKRLFDAVRAVKGSALTQADVDTINAALGAAPAPGVGRTLSAKGIEHIKASEGLRLKAYPDPASGGDPWTIGYGSTTGVKPGQVITEAQAEQMLRKDVARFEGAVNKLAPKTTQGQFDALVSFSFNVGEGNLAKSTLLKFHNAGDYAGAANEFSKWVNAAGRKMPGLVTRRAGEAKLYRSGAA